MAEIRGTPGADIVTVRTGDLFLGEAGDDVITLERWSAAVGGPGKDRIIAAPGTEKESYPFLPMLFLYYEQGIVTVDLEEGYLLDTHGSRDTLVNIQRVDGLKYAGDRAFGSSLNNYFHLGPGWREYKGTILVDGRGGIDAVGIGDGAPEEARGGVLFEVSADARHVRAWHQNSPELIYDLRNIEILIYTDPVSRRTETVFVRDLANLDGAGGAILLRGAAGWQTQAPGTATTITYSFLTGRPADGAEGGTGFWAFNAAQQAIVRSALARLSEQSGIAFVERSGASEEGQIRFGINQQVDTRGYSFVPDLHRGQARAGDVWLDVETATLLNPGQEGYYALLHELGHALGLQHPLDERDSSGSTVLLDHFANLGNTVMLDRSSPDGGVYWPTWFGALDIQALRQLYGARAYASGNDRYTTREINSAGAYTLIDDGGMDAIDASGSPVSVRVDLRPGQRSSIGVDARGISLRDNLLIATGTMIEQAVGTAWDDHLVGNQGANLLEGRGGNDLLDGQGGLDQAVFSGTRMSWSLQYSTTLQAWRVESRAGTGGAAMLENIERLRFDDRQVALDLGTTDRAGQALLLIGAVIGREAMLTKPDLMRSVIDLFDQGFSIQVLAGAVMRLPIWVGVLTPTNSSVDIARHLLTVVNGGAPSDATLTAAVQTLEKQPQGALLAELALSSANTQQVGLVGLAQTGYEYSLPPSG
jgi:hypothetical protein